ncbi:MAG TPA: N-acetylglucosamine kinase [Bacteroidia bacterium]|nr:N-acetylglucosamine kinase [Bacteroidia bacterium]
MKLIADSGSSKTEWNLIFQDGTVKTILSGGLNPYFLDEVQIAERISDEVKPEIPEDCQIQNIYFYGAGCAHKAKQDIVHGGLRIHFPEAKIEVHSDLLGAARSLCEYKEGLIGILGTGSNCAFYNGYFLSSKVPSLGFILGDEGGGVAFGKKILKTILYSELPQNLLSEFNREYNLSVDEILENIYRKPQPNRFIASFTPFVAKHKSEKIITRIVDSVLEEFFTSIILKFDEHKSFPLHLTGSVAWIFQDEIKTIGKKLDVSIGNISQSPGSGLVSFHKNEQA